MNYTVIIEPPAAQDIDNALLWIAERSPEAAVKWFGELTVAINSLTTFPTRCARAPESKAFDSPIRHLLLQRFKRRYRILFIIEDDRVHILHVRHAARKELAPVDGEVDTP